MNMNMENMERELGKSVCRRRPEGDKPITVEELLGESYTLWEMDVNLTGRLERKRTTSAQVVEESKEQMINIPGGGGATELLMMGLVSLIGCPIDAFKRVKFI